LGILQSVLVSRGARLGLTAILTAILSKSLLHPVRGLGLKAGQDVRIGIERQRNLAVPQCLHHDAPVNALLSMRC